MVLSAPEALHAIPPNRNILEISFFAEDEDPKADEVPKDVSADIPLSRAAFALSENLLSDTEG